MFDERTYLAQEFHSYSHLKYSAEMWSKTAWKCKVIIILSRSTRGNVFQKLLQQITAIVSPPSQALHHNYDGKRSLIVFIIPCFRIILFMHDHAMHMSFNGPCVSTCVWVYELSSLNGWPWDVGIQVGALKCRSKPSTHPTWWSILSWYTFGWSEGGWLLFYPEQ